MGLLLSELAMLKDRKLLFRANILQNIFFHPPFKGGFFAFLLFRNHNFHDIISAETNGQKPNIFGIKTNKNDLLS
jgi:hypothetical protein